MEINIDLGPLTDELEKKLMPNMDVVAEGMMNALYFIRDTWAAATQGAELPGMSKPIHDDAYFDALTASDAVVLDSSFSGRVVANYTTSNGKDGVELHEAGYPPYDMKPGLINGPRSKPLKNGEGRYNTVPFRHQTPGTVGVLGAPMPTDIHQYLLGKGPKPDDLNIRDQQIKYPDKPQSIIDAYFQGTRNPMTAAYQWKSGKYAGIQQVGTEGHSQYMTFRRVSSRSDPNSWIHPGQPPNPIMEAVKLYCEDKVREILEDAWQRATGEGR